MKADTVGMFTEMIRFCDLDDEPERIAKAVNFSTFEQVKAQEEENGFSERVPRAESFFRREVVGSWKERLNKAVAQKIMEEHSKVIRRFGYMPEATLNCD